MDVRSEDLVADGLFRVCDVYRGGGGYDQFPRLAAFFGLGGSHHLQFIVQVQGCTLDCPYCYVTRQGVWGDPLAADAGLLVDWFNTTPASVFHLMGGAPALYLEGWPLLLEALGRKGKRDWVFHSDLLLNERRPYPDAIIRELRHPRALYAVDIKGLDPDEWKQNTRQDTFPGEMLWENLAVLERHRVRYYITFTNVRLSNRREFWERFRRQFPEAAPLREDQSFHIDVIEYNAAPFVDDVPWGRS